MLEHVVTRWPDWYILRRRSLFGSCAWRWLSDRRGARSELSLHKLEKEYRLADFLAILVRFLMMNPPTNRQADREILLSHERFLGLGLVGQPLSENDTPSQIAALRRFIDDLVWDFGPYWFSKQYNLGFCGDLEGALEYHFPELAQILWPQGVKEKKWLVPIPARGIEYIAGELGDSESEIVQKECNQILQNNFKCYIWWKIQLDMLPQPRGQNASGWNPSQRPRQYQDRKRSSYGVSHSEPAPKRRESNEQQHQAPRYDTSHQSTTGPPWPIDRYVPPPGCHDQWGNESQQQSRPQLQGLAPANPQRQLNFPPHPQNSQSQVRGPELSRAFIRSGLPTSQPNARYQQPIRPPVMTRSRTHNMPDCISINSSSPEPSTASDSTTDEKKNAANNPQPKTKDPRLNQHILTKRQERVDEIITAPRAPSSSHNEPIQKTGVESASPPQSVTIDNTEKAEDKRPQDQSVDAQPLISKTTMDKPGEDNHHHATASPAIGELSLQPQRSESVFSRHQTMQNVKCIIFYTDGVSTYTSLKGRQTLKALTQVILSKCPDRMTKIRDWEVELKTLINKGLQEKRKKLRMNFNDNDEDCEMTFDHFMALIDEVPETLELEITFKPTTWSVSSE